MQIDCGATGNILPKKCVPDNVPIVQSPRQLNLYGNGASIAAEGTCKVLLKTPRIIESMRLNLL